MIRNHAVTLLVVFASTAVACSSGSAGNPADAGGSPADLAMSTGQPDGGAPDLAMAGSGHDLATTTPGQLTGTYGTTAIAPIAAAYWIGIPGNPAESGGGPFVYLFSAPVTCADLSHGSGWLTTIPTGTQVLEMIIGTTTTATPVSAAPHAAPNAAEVNYATGGSTVEARAATGTVTLTTYTKDVAADGAIDVTFPSGAAKGTFHATWCPSGHEL